MRDSHPEAAGQGAAMSGGAPADLFAARHYPEVRRPTTEAATLPPWCYTSAAFLEGELARLFRPDWNCVGRADRWVETGDYAALDVAGVPVIVLRDGQGGLRAFANLCRHRGMQLLEGEGRCMGIKCPYHGWTYSLTGRLAAAPKMKRSEGFDQGDFGLRSLRIESLEGFAFVALDGAAPPLESYLAGFPEVIAPYRLHDMVCTRRHSFTVACNWKLFIEIFLEYYHLDAVHGETLSKVGYQDPTPPEAVAGAFATQFGVHEGTSGTLTPAGGGTLPPIEGLPASLAGGTRYTVVYPGLIFALTTDSLWSYVCTPDGPASTQVLMEVCFPRASAVRADFAKRVAGYYERLDVGIAEDIAILERQQQALASPFAGPGRFCYLEELTSLFDRWVVETILDR